MTKSICKKAKLHFKSFIQSIRELKIFINAENLTDNFALSVNKNLPAKVSQNSSFLKNKFCSFPSKMGQAFEKKMKRRFFICPAQMQKCTTV